MILEDAEAGQGAAVVQMGQEEIELGREEWGVTEESRESWGMML